DAAQGRAEEVPRADGRRDRAAPRLGRSRCRMAGGRVARFATLIAREMQQEAASMRRKDCSYRGTRGDSMRAQFFAFPTARGLPRVVREDGPTALGRAARGPALGRVLDVTDFGDLEVERPRPGERAAELLPRIVPPARRQAHAFTREYAAGS